MRDREVVRRDPDEPRTGGPRYGEPNSERQRFMAAVFLETLSFAHAAAKSPCRGAARQCAAASGLDSARASCAFKSLRRRPSQAVGQPSGATGDVLMGVDL